LVGGQLTAKAIDTEIL